MINKQKKKKILLRILLAVIVLYFVIPPFNKVAQIGYIYYNIKYTIGTQETESYVFHRNNAVYLARMGKFQNAVKEMDKSIAALPSNVSESKLYDLYKDRADIKLYYGDYKGALNDLLRIPNHNINDYLVIAMLLKEIDKKKLAISYCNKIMEADIKAYAGYACIADIYASAGKYEAAVMIYDLLIDRFPKRAKYYADRSVYKAKLGDKAGSKEDYDMSKELSSFVDYGESITYNATHPKKLNMVLY